MKNIIQLIKDTYQNYQKNDELVSVIHPLDEMYLYLTTHPVLKLDPRKAYFESGAGMIQKLLDILIDLNIEISSIDNFLEFACGYGRFTRYLVREINRNRITVSDIYKDAVNFQKKTFKVKGIYSSHLPENLNINKKFNVIFVASLFSHLPNKTWKGWLHKLYSLLDDNGVLIFSTHGKKCMADTKNMNGEGFFYLKMSESATLPLNEYGTTYVTEKFVNKCAVEISGRKPVRFYEQYLWNYQDVYVIKKTNSV